MFGSRRHRLHAHPTPPELKRKIEKSIVREEKDEERNLKHVVKEMEETERAVHKAQKEVDKAEDYLNKAEMNKEAVLKALQKAEYEYDKALSEVHRAENNAHIKRRNLLKTQRNLQTKKTMVDAALKANDYHTAERNAKLATLRGPLGNSETFGVANVGSRASSSRYFM